MTKYKNLKKKMVGYMPFMDKVQEFKKEDGWLYALYGTPAESLCGTQVQQFR